METLFYRQQLRSIARWTIPPGFQEAIIHLGRNLKLRWQTERRTTLAANSIFEHAHCGERCFILGTGPSINLQDLTLLQNEICFSLNSFYLHRDYALIQPKYHVTTGLTPHPKIGPELGEKWFHEMEEKIGYKTTLFLNYGDRRFIQEHSFFQKNQAYYWQWGARWNRILQDGVDITKVIYPGESVAVVAIQVALYMGFKEIYLVGLDHDWILRYADRLYTHFYQPNQSIIEKTGVTDWSDVDWKILFQSQVNIWSQYENLRALAQKRGISIYNATAGGLLDVFPRVQYESLFD